MNIDDDEIQTALRELSHAMGNPALDWSEVSAIEIALIKEATRRLAEAPPPARVIDNVTEVYIFASNGFVNTAKRGEANTSTSRMTGEVTLGIGQRMVIERGDGVMKLVLP